MRHCLHLFCLVAVALAIGCGRSSDYPTASSAAPANTETVPPPPPAESTNWMQLVIPTMKSIKEDWPKIEESLKAQSGVKEVRYKPTEDDTIPDSIVLIKHTKDFDSKKAIEALDETGYKDASVKGF